MSINQVEETPLIMREAIEALPNIIRLVDHDEDTNLDLFCYTKCTKDDSDLVKQCRGVVFDGNHLILKAFPFTTDYNHEEVDFLSDNIKDCTFYDAHEGSLIRVFYYKTKWFTSTHRKLDAFRSKWSSQESFGTTFVQALSHHFGYDEETCLSQFQESLNKDHQYMFLVRNTVSNRIVCQAPDTPTVYHVGTFVNGKLDMNQDIAIPRTKQRKFESLNEMTDYISNINIDHLAGLICFKPDGTHIKIVHTRYQELFNIRGNEPSIKFRYLQVRGNTHQTELLEYLYPESVQSFREYEDYISTIAGEIYQHYVNRYIQKQHVVVPSEEFRVMKECHNFYYLNRDENIMTVEHTLRILNTQPPTALNRMIRHYKVSKMPVV